jgi:hypothetical protein
MQYLLVDLLTGHVLSQHLSREKALDEVLEEIRADGEETVETLGLMWRGSDVKTDSVSGHQLLELVRSHAFSR